MLRITQSNSAAQAKSYYLSGLEDASAYYVAGSSDAGRWFGRLANRLGLEGEVSKDQFFELSDNRLPGSSEKLNPRENAKRKIGYDVTLTAPKSVSLLVSVLQDHRVLVVFDRAVRETLGLLESEVEVRVRRGGLETTRRSGEILAACFTHFDARPIDGLVDPALHCHAFIFNSSHDPVENRRKALDFFPVVRDAYFYEAVFHSKLAAGIAALGYTIENKPYAFEVAGIGEENIRRFSRRTAEIEALADELGIQGNDKAKDQLGAKTRASKKLSLSAEEQIQEWRSRFDWDSVDLNQANGSTQQITAEECLELAIRHHFERLSVVPLRRVMATALELSLGQVRLEDLKAALFGRKDLVCARRDGVLQVTTREIIQDEREVVSVLRSSQGTRYQISPAADLDEFALDADQRTAVACVLEGASIYS